MRDTSSNVIYFLHDDIDDVFDERGNSFLALRKVQWAKEGTEPDPEKGKLEIRKWTVTPEKEIALKGCAFLTEDGPAELTKTLIKRGYGETKDLLLLLKEREDFKDSVNRLYDDEDESDDDEYFDARSALLE